MISKQQIEANCPTNGALYMLERGLHVLPLRENEKIPQYKNWPESSLIITASTVSTVYNANWGVHPGPSGHFVIDIDNKPGKSGDADWIALQAEHGEAPATFKVRTPSGGFHLYFRGEAASNRPLTKSIDVRGPNGYVVAPGSEIDGNAYRIVDDSPIAAAPQWLLDALNAKAAKPAVDRAPVAEIDNPLEIARAIEVLKEAKVATEGEGGDARTFTVACEMHDLWLSEEKAFELMLGHYNPRCVPEWSEDELATKVANAYRYAQNSHGARTVEAAQAAAVADFDEAPIPPPLESDDLDSILVARKYAQAAPPPRTDPVLWVGETGIAKPGDLVVVQAKVKAGKSAVLGAMMASIMGRHDQGHDYLGWRGDNPLELPLLHFDTEQSPEDHYDLIERARIRAGLEEAPQWLHSFCLTDVSLAKRRQLIFHCADKLFKEYGGLCAIFLDGIGDLCEDVNDPVASNRLVDAVYDMAIRYRCPFVNVLHENHSSETGKTRGHLGSQLERKAAANLRLEKDGKTGVIQLWGERLRRGHIGKGDGPSFVWSNERGMHVTTLSERDAKGIEREAAANELKKSCEEFLRVALPRLGDEAKAGELNEKALEAGLDFAAKGQPTRFAKKVLAIIGDNHPEFSVKKLGEASNNAWIISRPVPSCLT